ncbi:hypothetical protein EMIHUDRAFT_204455 [Emiliania huxleyi CCMP1516]|uniref:Peroxin-12 n=2 Tax=Emiliania huxleyi TaxID=2903 RepID=A0A0D3JYF7_EMIH1|nr:hypothetical protein EMIHUDRAFT_204455 [Emiliania huxleyi CCMP1516]EOD28542.1 hypothetical protein EMIHUDRAFT_204455 [Emiliania huxleyi CCMP1516]|eukprot:XP_005780971.1 hypothetical protein EMIHUDRAFT_204455 [Emiliania huxleyi CCMP1516]
MGSALMLPISRGDRSKTVSGDADMATVPGSSSSAGGPVLEVLAHERLMPALRSAFEYVAAQRHPWLLLRVHSLREELFAALSCALEAHSLLRHGASFSEHFYFMQRGGVRSARRAGWSPLDALADRFAAVRGPRRLLLEVLVLCAMSPMEQPTAAPSGYVFCAKCITRAVRRHGRCPLTHAPATLPSLVRLYETSRAPPAPPAEEPPALSSA